MALFAITEKELPVNLCLGEEPRTDCQLCMHPNLCQEPWEFSKYRTSTYGSPWTSTYPELFITCEIHWANYTHNKVHEQYVAVSVPSKLTNNFPVKPNTSHLWQRFPEVSVVFIMKAERSNDLMNFCTFQVEKVNLDVSKGKKAWGALGIDD